MLMLMLMLVWVLQVFIVANMRRCPEVGSNRPK
jgi:hypothetical protein